MSEVFPEGTQETITVEVPAEPERPVGQGDDFFTKAQVEEMLGKVRKEEKDKLYPQMSKWQEQAKTMEEELRRIRESNEAAQQAEQARLEKEKADAERQHREEADLRTLLDEERARREQQETDWQNQLQALRDEQAVKEAALEKERYYLSLQDYRNRKLAEERENDTIDPRLVDYIQGDSEEEIDASIAMAKQKTEELFQEFAAAQARRPAPRGVYPTSPITGPSDMITGGTKTFTPDDIKNMSMTEFAKYRSSLLNVARPQDRGILG